MVVTVELGGVSRTLRFGMAAWEALEDSGNHLSEFLPKLREKPLLMKTVHRCLWAMLQDPDGGVGRDQAPVQGTDPFPLGLAVPCRHPRSPEE